MPIHADASASNSNATRREDGHHVPLALKYQYQHQCQYHCHLARFTCRLVHYTDLEQLRSDQAPQQHTKQRSVRGRSTLARMQKMAMILLINWLAVILVMLPMIEVIKELIFLMQLSVPFIAVNVIVSTVHSALVDPRLSGRILPRR
jgi:hypothetical protein